MSVMSDCLGTLVLAGVVGAFMFVVICWFVWAIQTEGWLTWFLEMGSWESIDKRYERRGVEKTLLHGEQKYVEENLGERYLRTLQEHEDSWARFCRRRAYAQCKELKRDKNE